MTTTLTSISQKPLELFTESFIDLISNKTDNYIVREYFVKLLQNSSLLINSQTKNPKAKTALRNIQFASRDARFVFAVFKIFKDSVIINKTIMKNPFDFSLNSVLNNGIVVNRLLLNLFENLNLYSRLKCFKKDNSALYGKLFNSFWALMITFNLGKKFTDYQKLSSSKDDEKDKLKKKVIKVQMLSSAFDYLICLHGSGFTKFVFGKGIPDFWRGFGGSAASILALYATKLNEKI